MMLMLQGLNAQYTGQVHFSPAEVNIEQANGWHIAGMAGCTMETEPGKPYLPVKLLNIAIPAGKTVTGIEILVKQQQELAGTYNIMPTQPEQIPGEPEPDPVGPEPGIYNADALWPVEFMYYTTSGFNSGVHIAGLLYYPLQYNPVTQKLYLTTHLEYRLIFADQFNNPVKPRRMAEHTLLKLKASIKGYVENPADVDNFLQIERVDQTGVTAFIPDEFPNFNGSAVEYLIITNQALAGGFQEIADWKTQKGVPAVVRTVEWIYSHYPGADQAEKVRNFIIDAYQNWGIQYVLLGGDSDIVPIRYAWISHFNHGQLLSMRPFGEFIPADMYFACLDGNWNADGDATYGEANWNRLNNGYFYKEDDNYINIDGVDRMPEVYTGRIPVEDMEELNRWKVKYFEYVKSSDNNKNNALLFSADSDAVYSSQMDMIDNVFPTFVTRTKLYEKDGFVNTDVYNHMNGLQGIDYQFVSGYGHGGATSFEACVGNLDRIHMDNLSNSIRSQFLYLTHCSTMEYDKDCVAERYLNALNGGVGVIANTRFGWTGHPSSYTGPFVQKLYNTSPIIGLNFNEIKTLFNTSTHYDGVRRWEFFALNLASDPELAFWTNNPQSLQVISPASVPTGQNNIQIEISNLATDVEAMICLYKEDEVYSREMITGTGGTITANITCMLNTTGEILVTVTAKNYIPVEDEIQVTINPGTHLFASGYQVNDSGSGQSNGNNNQLADAGETIELFVSVMNQGLTATSGVSGVLSSASPYITITGSQALYGNIASLGEVANQLPFVFEVSVDCPKNQTAAFTLVLTDGVNSTYTSNFYLPLHAPEPLLVQTTLSTTINNDNIIDPGDVVSVLFTVYNLGNGPAMSVTGEITSTDPMVTGITSAIQAFGDIEPFGSQENSNPFVFTVSQNYQGGPIELLLVLTTSLGQEWEIPVVLNYPNVITGLDFIGYNTSIALTWDPVALSEAAGYNVYRCDIPDGIYVKLNNQIISGFSGYTNYDLEPVTTYYYKVAAVSSSGLVGHLTEPLTAWTTLAYHADWPMTSINTDDFGHRSEGSPAALDVTGDGDMEIFFTSFGSANAIGGIFGFKHDMEELYDIDNNPTTVSGFYKYNNVGSMCIPAIGDINNDGLYEIITTTKSSGIGTDEKRVFVHSAEDTDNDGKPDLLWSENIGGPDSRGACLADINGDGNLEIIVKSNNDDPFIVLSSDGSYYPGWPVNHGKTGFILPAACDLNNNGLKEVIFGCKEGIYIYNDDGTQFIESNPDGLFFNNLHGSAYDRMDAAPTFIDLTGNGYYDMIWVSGRRTGSSSAEGRVFALDRFGNFINGWGYEDHIIDLTFLVSDILYLPSATVGYVDYNGAKQLVVTIAENGKIYCWDALGNALLNFPIEVPGLEAKFISPLIADIDEDDELELIVASNSINGGIYAFKFDGTPVVGWPLRVRSTSTPFIADIDDDGKNEIIATAEIICHVWKTEGDADKIEWGSYRKDNFNSGIYDNICQSDGPPLMITENTVWTDNMSLSGNLLIDRGVALTIKGKLEMPSNARIIVDRGAKLVIDGGKVTSVVYCNGPWRGIEVWGNSSLGHIPPSNQGWVQIINGGVIENAVCGIRTSKTIGSAGQEADVYGYSGGIVQATGAIFRNNRNAVEFLPHDNGNNLSFFRECQFITDAELIDAELPDYFLRFNGVQNIKVQGCSFSNTHNFQESELKERGHGIFASNSDIIIENYCTSQTVPCPPQDVVNNEFSNLYYAIYGIGTGQNRTVKIEDVDFNENIRSVYISALDFAEITLSRFNTWPETEQYQEPQSYGLYLDACTGYTVEENTFAGTALPVRAGLGLVINNSGPDANIVYNNLFSDLLYASIAQNSNRNGANPEHGLCYKCNEFINNEYDIFISSEHPHNRDQGIAIHQGADIQGDNTAPAGNIFTIPSNVFDISNGAGPVIYFMHETHNGFNLTPDPVSAGVTVSTVRNTVFSREGSCPSNLGGSEPPAEEEKMMAAGLQSDSVYTELAILVDGGNTEAMATTVITTTEPEAPQTQGELIQNSPYLSDSILQTTITREDVFTNPMIYDVMVANPQSGKSEVILDMLEGKTEPMPSYLMADIYDGRLTVSDKEALEAMAGHWIREGFKAYTNLFRMYSSDSIIENLTGLLSTAGFLQARYKLAMFYLGNQQYAAANQVLAELPLEFTLDARQAEVHQKYLDLSSLWQSIAGDSVYFTNPGSSLITDIETLFGENSGIPSVYARNLLVSAKLLEHNEKIILSQELKKARWYDRLRPTEISGSKALKVYPNPAGTHLWVSIPEDCQLANTIIEVLNAEGRKTISIKPDNHLFMIDTSKWPAGLYLLKLWDGKQWLSEKVLVE